MLGFLMLEIAIILSLHNFFFEDFIKSVLLGTVIYVIFGYYEYISLEKKVKKLNK